MNITEQELKEALIDPALVEFIDANIGHMTQIRPEGFGITAQEYAEMKNVGPDPARNALNKLVKAGQLKKERMVIVGQTGANAYVYYRPEDDPVRNASDGDE